MSTNFNLVNARSNSTGDTGSTSLSQKGGMSSQQMLGTLAQILNQYQMGSSLLAEDFEEAENQEGEESSIDSTASSCAAMSQLAAYIKNMEKKREKQNETVYQQAIQQNYDSEKAMKDGMSDATLEEATTNTSSSSSSMDDVFAFQGWICKLDQDAMNANADQSLQQIEMNNAFQKTTNKEYEDLKKKLEKLEKEKHSHSFLGFFKGLGKLIADIGKLMADAALHGNTSHDIDAIKHNDAIGDIGDIGKLLFSTVKLAADALALDTHGIKKNWSDIETNPSLGLAIQLLAYAAAAAAIIATGGSTTAVVMAALMVMSQIQVTDASGDKVNLFEAAADGIGHLFHSQVAGDIALGAIAAGSIMTGDVALAGMIMGTTLMSMAPKIADDSGLSGKNKAILTLSLEIGGALLTVGGGCSALSSASENAAAGASEGVLEQTALATTETAEDASVATAEQIEREMAETSLNAATETTSPAPAEDILTDVSAEAEEESTVRLVQEQPVEAAPEESTEEAIEERQQQVAEQIAQTSSQENGLTFMEKLQQTSGYVYKTSTLLNGILNVMSGGKTIDMGYQEKDVMELQGRLDQNWAHIKFGDQMMQNLMSQRDNLNAEYSQMIDSFGMIATPGIATAEALV